MKKYAWILGLVFVLAVAGAATAQMGRGEGRPPIKFAVGTLDSVNTSASTVTINVEKYMKRGGEEAAASGERLTVQFGERTRFGKNGEKASIGDFKAGDKVVACILEKDGKTLLVALSDPETAQKFREKMQDKFAHGRGDRMGPGGRGDRMGRNMEGRGQQGKRMMQRGLPIYGEVIKIEGEYVIVKPEQFPREELGIPGGEGGFFGPPRDGAGQGEGMGLHRQLPDQIKVKLTDDTQYFIGGAEGSKSDVKVGAKLVFKCGLPEGDWSRDNKPEFVIAKRVADIASVKKFIEEHKPMRLGGRA
ncbi:MAG: hypothetical protein HRF49_01990 [bacterium]|jgi:hypothetical protein